MSNFKQTFLNIIGAVIVVSSAFLILSTIGKVWPIDTTTIKSTKILTPVVIAGQEVRWENVYCTAIVAPVEIIRELKDDSNRIWLTSSLKTTSTEGCGTSPIQSMLVPISATNGTYQVKNTLIFSVKGYRDIPIVYTTPTFKVEQPSEIEELTPDQPETKPVSELTLI